MKMLSSLPGSPKSCFSPVHPTSFERIDFDKNESYLFPTVMDMGALIAEAAFAGRVRFSRTFVTLGDTNSDHKRFSLHFK